jgi:hypothetical protein
MDIIVMAAGNKPKPTSAARLYNRDKASTNLDESKEQ